MSHSVKLGCDPRFSDEVVCREKVALSGPKVEEGEGSYYIKSVYE